MPTYDLEILIRTSKAGSGLQDTEAQVKSFTERLKGVQSTAMGTAKVLGAVAGGAALAWRTIGQGAEIENTQRRFDRLSDSIGTTSDTLENKLRAATRGTRSDLELMASAADLMGLGLAKNQDELVRMTRVSGALNMNMNQLVLTLTNQTTARFDQLGVSVDGFKEKVAALEKQGYSTNAAFKEAFLQQAEAQIAKVGDTADTTAGAMQRLTARARNFVDDGLEYIARRSGPALEGLANYFEAVDKAQTDMNAAVAAGIITQDEANTIVNLAARGYDQWQQRLRDVRGELREVNTRVENVTNTTAAYYIGMGQLAIAEREAQAAGAFWNVTLADAARVTIEAADAADAYRTKLEEQRAALITTREEQERLVALTGDYFTTATEAFGTADDITTNLDAQNAALYAAADAADASAAELAMLGLATGQLSEEQAIAAMKAAALQTKILELGDAIANGMDPQEALNRLQTFQAGLDAQDFRVRIGLDAEPVTKDSSKVKQAIQPALDDVKGSVDDLTTSFVVMAEDGAAKLGDLATAVTPPYDEFVKLTGEVGTLKDLLYGLNGQVVNIRVNYTTTGTPPPSGGGGSSAPPPAGAPAGSYATGGIVPGGWRQPVMIEAHGGEMVVDTSKGGAATGKSVVIENLNVNVGGGFSRSASRQIAASIAEELGRL